jgi:2'-5' RNA ligase
MSDVWSLGIPVPEETGNELNQLILNIAEKEKSLGFDKNLPKKIQAKAEFHITLGTFHPGVFELTGNLFKHLYKYFKNNEAELKTLQDSFKGTISITGIGFDSNSIAESQVIWASVAPSQTQEIRGKIHELIERSGADVKHFKFTDPHITLFMKIGKGDLHGIPKKRKLALSKFIAINKINFAFEQVSLYKKSKIILTFGKEVWNGKPKDKFKAMFQAELIKRKPAPAYNWGALFQKYSKEEALVIKNTILTQGAGKLKELGYNPRDIMPLIRVKK